MNRIQISETEYRWYDSEAPWAALDGEVARARLEDTYWVVDAFRYGDDKAMRPARSSWGARDIDHAEEIVRKSQAGARADHERFSAMEREARQEEDARKREIAAEQDRMTRDLMMQLDRAERAAAMREVSHPSYGLSGCRARDEAEIAGIKIQIENRRREIAAKMEAA